MSKKEKSKIDLQRLWQQVDFKKTSTITLILSNLLVISFAIADNLSAVELLWIYWTQSVIIGVFNFIKIFTLKEFNTNGIKINNSPLQPTKSAAKFSAVFFLLHYGFFHFIYAVFIGSFPFINHSNNSGPDGKFILLSAAMFFVSYLIEFINYNKEEKEELPNLGRLISAPYARIIPMHLTIILGGFIGLAGKVFSGNTNLPVIILFTTIKTIVDLITHSVDINLLSKKSAAATD